MRNSQPKHHIDGLLVLLLFGVFAVCILSVLLIGARVYRQLNDRDQSSYDRRTAVQYVATKIRQAHDARSFSVETTDGICLLTLSEPIDGVPYLTRLYCHDGYLRELFSSAEYEFAPQDGETILPAQDMDLSLEDGMLSVTITVNDTPLHLVFSLRGGEEVAS